MGGEYDKSGKCKEMQNKKDRGIQNKMVSKVVIQLNSDCSEVDSINNTSSNDKSEASGSTVFNLFE